jgi:hypothetical protein
MAVLATLKFFGIVATVCLGIFGIAHDYRRDGILTKAGRWAIAMMAVAGSLSLGAAVVEQVLRHETEERQRVEAALQRPFTDLTLTWRLSPDESQILERAAMAPPAWIEPRPQAAEALRLAVAMRGGEVAVVETGSGWKINATLDTALGFVDREYTEHSPEWQTLVSAMQRIIGERFELSLTSGQGFIDLAGRDWPTGFIAERGVVRFQIRSPQISPLDFASEEIVVTKRGGSQPLELRLSSTDPRVELDLALPLQWTERTSRTVVGPDQEPYQIHEYRSGPHAITMNVLPSH